MIKLCQTQYQTYCIYSVCLIMFVRGTFSCVLQMSSFVLNVHCDKHLQSINNAFCRLFQILTFSLSFYHTYIVVSVTHRNFSHLPF